MSALDVRKANFPRVPRPPGRFLGATSALF
ncbi:MAG: hypothetical protein JWO68_4282, partial [Actinomycetia bacterium]|nr:hypothetical protein [Actinomycetes bacterium]